MDQTLQRFDVEWRNGDRDLARKLASEFIKMNKVALAPIMANLTIIEMVALVEGYRAAGREEERIIADMWLLTQPVRAIDAPLKSTEAPMLFCGHEHCVRTIVEYRENPVKDLAAFYVSGHRAALTAILQSKSLPEIVGMVDFYRELEQSENVAVADMWLAVEYGPQMITGEIRLSGNQRL